MVLSETREDMVSGASPEDVKDEPWASPIEWGCLSLMGMEVSEVRGLGA